MLGSTLVKTYQSDYHVFATSLNERGLDYFKNYMSFDLNSENYTELLKWANPDVIIHCAALTNGNYCASNPEESFRINGLTLKKMADTQKINTHIIYISTDAVFPASLSEAKETDCVCPESVYGKSKELGEFFLVQSESDFTIVRTTIVGFNQKPKKQGFVERIINTSLNNEEIGLFSDVLFTPITCIDLAKQLKLVMKSRSPKNRGVLHIAGKGVFSKYTFGISLLKALEIPTTNVLEKSILKFEDRAKRSTDQSLNSSFFEIENGTTLPNLEKTIQTLTKEYYG